MQDPAEINSKALRLRDITCIFIENWFPRIIINWRLWFVYDFVLARVRLRVLNFLTIEKLLLCALCRRLIWKLESSLHLFFSFTSSKRCSNVILYLNSASVVAPLRWPLISTAEEGSSNSVRLFTYLLTYHLLSLRVSTMADVVIVTPALCHFVMDQIRYFKK